MAAAKLGHSDRLHPGRSGLSSRYDKSEDDVVRAHLKKMYSLELPVSLEEHCPANPENFGLSIRLEVGPVGSDAADSFDLFVCTPYWTQEQLAKEGPVWGRHTLLILEYDYDLILQAVTRRIDACQGKNWHEVANNLARFTAWEFEDYQEPAA